MNNTSPPDDFCPPHAGERALVVAVCLNPRHALSKYLADSIRLVAGLGVEGDAHAGATVKHRSRVRRDPTAPNLRQVHLIATELLDDLLAQGFDVAPGQMGENITTRNLNLLSLPTGARLHIGAHAVLEITGLRNPCLQLNGLHPGLMDATLDRNALGGLVRKAGVMGMVLTGGAIAAGDQIRVENPPGVRLPLTPV